MKNIKAIITLFLCAIFIGGCSASPQQNAAVPTDSAEKLQVYTSFYAMYDFARMIGGDKAEIINLVPVGTEPHDWEPKASDIAKITGGDLFIYHGSGMESWPQKVLASSSETGELITIEASEGITPESDDPHMWLDPELALIEIENICAGFEQADPKNAKYYQSNLAKSMEKLQTLDEKYNETLKNCSKQDIIVSHQAYGYLCDAYGLTQRSITGFHGEGDASPSQIAEIVNFIQANDIKYIFFESLMNNSITKPIENETGVKTLELNPFEGDSNDRDYFTVMEENLKNLEKALK